MNSQTDAFEVERHRAARSIAWLSLVAGPLNIAVAWWIGAAFLIAAIGGALFSLVAVWVLTGRRAEERIFAAQALTGQTIVLNAALMGNPMQIDAHMVYFASLAIIVSMAGLRPVLIAAATIAVHHLTLTFLMPALVYPTTDLLFNVGRTAFHAVVVVAETIALGWAISSRLRLQDLSVAHQRQAEEALAGAEAALADAEADKRRAVAAETEAKAALKAAADARRDTERAHAEASQGAAARLKEQEAQARAMEARERALVDLLDTFRDALGRMAQGDLSTRITAALASEFEDLRRNYNDAMQRLEDAMTNVAQEAESIRSQSREINLSANDLSDRTERQAGTLTDVSASIDQLAKAVRAVADDTGSARQRAESTRAEADKGKEIMTRAVAAMEGIHKSSGEVQKITSVIDDIAFQTNLLALNAGVEAARAGEAGRGFAVVASEVRALAQRSSEAAREINELISSSVTGIANGAKLVNQTGEALAGINAAVQQIAEAMASITTATEEQSAGVAEVNQSIAELEAVTQKNAAMFEETTAANSMLAQSTERLTALVDQFRCGGTVKPPAPVALPRAS
ncbi:methyl-accepting chemotaxis protein [Acidimangrovimonas sediminis]|uniref:methyl-accepting chemotaxis protein n=1 Tax=Acidimangrovimonas sediminis TaxID=2056283 RepID=UPI000C80CF36|nr:methyl-accepting chemotaxis protein [Acidimangrovimonas sediminis]